MKSKGSIFEYKNYKTYLQSQLEVSGEGRGRRSKLATHLGIQVAFVSQVLNGGVHFSLEHAMRINDFLSHTSEESHYFMLLVQFDRAGSKMLEEYYKAQINQIHEKRALIQERINVKTGLTDKDQMTYYSSWIYAAVHILTTIPQYQTVEAIAQYLKLPKSTVAETVEFLSSTGLILREGETLKPGTARIHLARNSPMISKHHANWRMQAVRSLEVKRPENLNYSSVISISKRDAEKIKAKVLELLEQTEPVIQASTEESLYCFSVDFFEIN